MKKKSKQKSKYRFIWSNYQTDYTVEANINLLIKYPEIDWNRMKNIIEVSRNNKISTYYSKKDLENDKERGKKAKELLKSGESSRHVAMYLNIPAFLIEKFIYQVNNFNSKAIKEAFKYTLDADLTLKTKKTKVGVIFESLVFKLCSLR